ncbi:MAG TPA: PH domain-containing protein [Anaerolineales bacterium]|nr:PH domain-containing protein [Anaerolineales bacterium]
MTNPPNPPGKPFEDQDESAARAVEDRIQQILTSGEEILHVAMQNPVTALSAAPDSVVLTNKRFIIYRPKFLGGAQFEDYIWRDLSEARLEEGLLSSKISLKSVTGKLLSMEHMHKGAARKVYSLAQDMEERVREERRLREMEEKRAAAGGINISGGLSGAAPATPAQPADDPVEKLGQLKRMLEGGLITAEEYEAKKKELLARL